MIIRKLITFFAVLMLLASTATAQTVYTGTISETVTLSDGASITLNNATITGGIVCEGSATITLVGTNSVSGATNKAGIQIGGSGTTLTIKGDGSLTATGGGQSAGIGLSRAWDPANDVTGGDIVIEGGNITANGGSQWGAGIGTGVIYGNGSAKTARIGNVTIKGGTVKATGGTSADGIGTGYTYNGCTNAIGTVTIYDGIDMVDASSIKNFDNLVYMHEETNVTDNKTDYFTIITEDGDRRIIVPKDDTDYTITIANDIEHGTLTGAATAKYMEKVTITVTPDFGYRLSHLVVKDADNNDVATTGNTFLMPKGNVTVSAVFEEGTHGTTEFAWGYFGPDGFVTEATIYDGLTTVNLQQGQSYTILKYDNGYSYSKFLLDNSTYSATIPYSGGTGTFSEFVNATNFKVDYNGEEGFYDITMTDAGNGKWSVSIQKTVPVVADIPDQEYTSSEITPEPLVLAGSLSLTKGTDYEYSYSNNTNVGTATVTVTFKGNYASLGSVEKTFTIVPKVTEDGALTLTEDQNGKTATLDGAYTGTDAFVLTEDIAVTSVTFNRTFTPGATSTIILPFAISSRSYSGGTFYEFQSVDYENGKWVASLTKVAGDIAANKPYLFVPSGDKLTITGGVTLTATFAEEYADNKGDWSFKGVYKVKDWETGVKTDYFFASASATSTAGNAVNAGDFVRIGNECHLNPFRCYLSYSGSDQSLSKSAKELPTSIEVRLIDEVSSVVEPNENPSESGEIITPVSEITPDSGIKVWSFGGTVIIEAQPNTDYTIVDLSGRTLKNGVTHSTRETVTLSRRAAGIVIVKIGNKTFKVNY